MKDLKWHLGQAINYYDCLWQDIFSLDGKGAWEFFQNWTVLTDFPLCIVTNAWHKAITVIEDFTDKRQDDILHDDWFF